VVSAKGAPGVTVCAAALVAMAHNPAVSSEGAILVEADPAGGDLEVLAGSRTGEPSLLHAAADLRRDGGPDALVAHGVEAVPGLPGLLAPVAAHAAGPVVEAVSGSLLPALAAVAGWVVLDGGRWDRSQPSARRIVGADVVAAVCRSTAVSIAHARDLILPLRTASPSSTVVVIQVGNDPYPPAQTAEVVDVPVLGPLAWDPKGVTGLWAGGATSRWRSHSALARSARQLLDELAVVADARPTWDRQGVNGHSPQEAAR